MDCALLPKTKIFSIYISSPPPPRSIKSPKSTCRLFARLSSFSFRFSSFFLGHFDSKWSIEPHTLQQPPFM